MSERDEVNRYRMRDRDSWAGGPRFEVIDSFDGRVILRISDQVQAEKVAAAFSQEYRIAERRRNLELGAHEESDPVVVPTEYWAKNAEARREFKYTNALAPKSKWKFIYHYPGGYEGEHDLVVDDAKVPGIVAEMSEAITRLHEIHSGITLKSLEGDDDE